MNVFRDIEMKLLLLSLTSHISRKSCCSTRNNSHVVFVTTVLSRGMSCRTDSPNVAPTPRLQSVIGLCEMNRKFGRTINYLSFSSNQIEHKSLASWFCYPNIEDSKFIEFPSFSRLIYHQKEIRKTINQSDERLKCQHQRQHHGRSKTIK
jgi:hypothetical protein